MLKHYARIYYPNVFMSDDYYKEVPSRDIEAFTWPERAYAVCFYDRTEIEANGETLKGEYSNPSPTYYRNSQLMSLEDVRNWPERGRALLSNMEINNWPYIVKTEYGQCFPVGADEKVVLV